MPTTIGPDFQINGEALVVVKGNGALASNPGSQNPTAGVWELGLSEDAIVITPKFYHKDILIDSYGPSVPAELMWFLAEMTIRMNLVHFDLDVVNNCVVESMAGGTLGNFTAAGTPQGGGQLLYNPGNHYIGLNILSPVLNFPWLFPACVLTEQPIEWPVGTSKSVVRLVWRAIPYRLPPTAQPTIPIATPEGVSVLTAGGGQSVLVATGGPTTAELRSQGASLYESTLFTSGSFDNGGGGDF